uniref:Uncharacterized protein n=1 Tax=Oryza meridionalis TaxID=40149 RepID=A0A0E0D365_9ORYZ
MERGGGAIPFRATNIAAAAGTPTSASTAGRPQQGDRENAVSAEIERVNKLPANNDFMDLRGSTGTIVFADRAVASTDSPS